MTDKEMHNTSENIDEEGMFEDDIQFEPEESEKEASGIQSKVKKLRSDLQESKKQSQEYLTGWQKERASFANYKAEEEKKRAEKALARMGLTLDVEKPVGSYSLAVQQMVAIARALDVDAKVLVLDEPTSSLDPDEVRRLYEVMRKLRSEGLVPAVLYGHGDETRTLAVRAQGDPRPNRRVPPARVPPRRPGHRRAGRPVARGALR
mgnify:CR=1 FL=1